MKVVRVAAALGLLAWPALVALPQPVYAQMPNINLIPELPSKTPEEKEADQEKNKAYQESLKKIPDAKSANDPWGGFRSSDAPKAAPKARAAKPAAKTTATARKTKNGSPAN